MAPPGLIGLKKMSKTAVLLDVVILSSLRYPPVIIHLLENDTEMDRRVIDNWYGLIFPSRSSNPEKSCEKLEELSFSTPFN